MGQYATSQRSGQALRVLGGFVFALAIAPAIYCKPADGAAMRILFSTVKDIGHITPLVPYARRLRDLGHEVRVATSDDEGAVAVLQKAGLTHAPFDGPAPEELQAIMKRVDELKGEEAIAFGFREGFAGAAARAALPKLQRTIQEFCPDLIVRESAEFASLVAAEAAGVSQAGVAVYCGEYEAWIARQVAGAVDKLRTLVGLKSDDGLAHRNQRTFTSFPPSFDRGPPLADRPAAFRVAPEIPTGQASSASLPDWMPAGEEPFLFMTFGTVAGRSERVRNVYRVLLEAVGCLPVKALLTTGPVMPRDELGVIPDNVRVEKFVPQAEIMSHTRAVVCHGGSGTLLSSLATGCPVVVIPLFADQPANARAAEAAGAGIAVFTQDADEIAKAIRTVLASEAIPAGAKAVAAQLASMHSMNEAVAEMMSLAGN
jgi:UDP:flavonoid glycosyltransferase YjiC (YdhE family)